MRKVIIIKYGELSTKKDNINYLSFALLAITYNPPVTPTIRISIKTFALKGIIVFPLTLTSFIVDFITWNLIPESFIFSSSKSHIYLFLVFSVFLFLYII